MAYYTSETINNIRNIDLLSYLQDNDPDELVQISRDNYCTKTHDSLKISNGLWYWFSKGIGGKSALDYLVKVKEYSFVDAIQKILREYDIDAIPKESYVVKKTPSDLILPEKNTNNDKIIKYLQSRGISKELITECINRDFIYEDIKSNVVFVGYDSSKVARFASIRATNNTRFMHEAKGSNKAFSFQLADVLNAENVHVFESAIDLLSYVSLIKMSNKEIDRKSTRLNSSHQQ